MSAGVTGMFGRARCTARAGRAWRTHDPTAADWTRKSVIPRILVLDLVRNGQERSFGGGAVAAHWPVSDLVHFSPRLDFQE